MKLSNYPILYLLQHGWQLKTIDWSQILVPWNARIVNCRLFHESSAGLIQSKKIISLLWHALLMIYLVSDLILISGRVSWILDESRTLWSVIEVDDFVQVWRQRSIHDLETGRTHAAIVDGEDLTNLDIKDWLIILEYSNSASLSQSDCFFGVAYFFWNLFMTSKLTTWIRIHAIGQNGLGDISRNGHKSE